jgi:glycosyltransferase involved in cell wall biosynthesis
VRNSAANAEVVGDAGVTFDDANEFESLKERIEHLLAHPEVVEEYRLKGVARVKARYDWEKVTDDYVTMFLALARKTNP